MRIEVISMVVPLCIVVGACSDGDDAGVAGGTGATGGVGAAGGGSVASSGGGGNAAVLEFTAVDARPAVVKVLADHDLSKKAPLLVLLHAYGESGATASAYLGIEPVALARGFVYTAPDGIVDESGERFWNATDACCDQFANGVDDSEYLIRLVDEIQAQVNIDFKQVYFMGHSNGGFMAYRMACDHDDRIAAIVSLAGETYLDDSLCKATKPVSLMQIQGDADEVVPYLGGPLFTGVDAPGAEASVASWAARDGCNPALTDTGMKLDLDETLDGDETTVAKHVGCTAGYDAELLTIGGGSNAPSLTSSFAEMVVDFMLAHPRP